MFGKLRDLLELIRFSHTVFALPFALMAAVLAWTAPAAKGREAVPFRLRDLLGILICMVCARSAAMAFNRLVDRDVDGANPRTRNRHLPTGRLTVGAVVAFTVFCSLGFVAGTLFFLPNRLPLYLALPVLAFLLGYSFTKRFTAASHFWLGAALMLAPISAWIAIRGGIIISYPADLWPAVVLGAAVLLWVAGFDILYSCQDVEFDRRAQLHSIPSTVGVAAALRLAALCHFLMLIGLACLPLTQNWGGPPLSLGWLYWTAILLVGLLLAYEHWIVRPDDLTRVNVAFFQINALISIGLLTVIVIDVVT